MSSSALDTHSGESTTAAVAEAATVANACDPTDTLALGVHVARYAVLELIGSGGMGVVYAAYDPILERRVALKVLHAERTGSCSLGAEHTRLLREAQAMAKLSHPNVVLVYDVGIVGDRLFIAMELIEGETLQDWFAGGRRSWREIVSMFVRAGRGLAAAHDAGIVHRDFKPANVLVDRDGRPRVADFGLAAKTGVPSTRASFELLDYDRTRSRTATGRTRSGAIAGTPAYMSPQQHLGLSADATSDQFSLCVALYEALYGRRPFSGKGYDLVRSILNGRVRTSPSNSTVPSWVRRVLLRGLAGDPAARWPSMDALLEALDRDPNARRRSWRVAAAVGVMAAGLSIGASRVGAQMGSPCASADENLAGVWDRGRAADVERAVLASKLSFAAHTWAAIDGGLSTYAESWSAMRRETCESISVGAPLDRQMGCLGRQRTELAAVVDVLSDADRATVEHALDLIKGLEPPDHCANGAGATMSPPSERQAAAVADIRDRLARARALVGAGRFAQSMDVAGPALADARGVGYDPVTAEALYVEARADQKLGHDADAREAFAEAAWLATASKHDALAARASIALVYLIGYRMSDLPRAMDWARSSRAALLRSGLGPDMEAWLENNIAAAFMAQGRYSDALPHMHRALSLHESVFGADDARLCQSLSNIGVTLLHLGRYQEAEAYLQRGLQRERERVGLEHPNVASPLTNLATAVARQGRNDEAVEHFRAALLIRERALGPDHPRVASSLGNLGSALLELGRVDSAVVASRRAVAVLERSLGADHPKVVRPLTNLGIALTRDGRPREAVPLLHRAVAILERGLGPDHPHVVYPLAALGNALSANGRSLEAVARLERALALCEMGEVEDWQLAFVRTSLGRARARARARARSR